MPNYEFLEGSKVCPTWSQDKVPVIPQRVRERLRFPARYTLATLSPELKETFNAKLYEGARSYLANWPLYSSSGKGPLFVGGTGSGISWTAAGLANEIVLRSEGLKDINASWLAPWMLRIIQDAKDLKMTEKYQGLQTNMFKHDLVVVDDLLSARNIDGGVQFLQVLYSYRYDNNLPTITTLSKQTEDPWFYVSRAFGKNFTDRLLLTADSLVFNTTSVQV